MKKFLTAMLIFIMLLGVWGQAFGATLPEIVCTPHGNYVEGDFWGAAWVWIKSAFHHVDPWAERMQIMSGTYH